jgi:hypothetical protein
MIATRVTRGPYRVLRRLARKLTKPLRLRITAAQLATSDENIAHFEAVRTEAARLIAAEHRRQVDLLMKRNQFASW